MYKFNTELFSQVPVVGILRGISEVNVAYILKAFYKAGFNTIEITIDSLNAEKIISNVISEYGGKLNIGAGTVLDEAGLERALKAGAQFIVTPNVNESIINYCVKSNIPVFPGAYTPTEICNAWNLGATMVKVFPVGSAGSEYIKSLKAPLKKIQLLPTGGITMENVVDYIQAGANGFGISSGLFKKDLIKNKDWIRLSQHLISFRSTIVELMEFYKQGMVS